MAEPDTDNKPTIITGSTKKVRKTPKWLKWPLLTLLVLLVVVGGVIAYKAKKTTRSTNTEVPTVTVDGVTYKALFETDKPVKAEGQQSTISNQQVTSDLEKKVASNQASTQDYLNLAQLYVVAGDKAKAIENYQKAIQTADHKAEDYASFTADTQKIIDKLQANGI